MLRWRILKYVGVLLPLTTLIASPFLSPITQRLLNRSDLRLFTINDKQGRTQTVALHNGGGVPLSKVFVGLHIEPETTDSVADIYFAPNQSTPRHSFVECLSHGDFWTVLPSADRERLTPVVDDHSGKRTLYDLDAVINDALEAKLKSESVLMTGLTELQKEPNPYDRWHDLWMKKCEGEKSSSPLCKQVESVLQTWEAGRRGFQAAALKAWQESTGVEVIPPSRHLSPNGLVHFAFGLGADESAFLQVRYGPNPMPFASPEIVSNPSRTLTRVDNENDLVASSFWIFLKYYPLFTTAWFGLIVLSLWVAWPLIRPPSLLRNHAVFNLALSTDDPSHWELTAQRQKYEIFREYRRQWNRVKKTPLGHSPEEILEFIKSCAIDEKGKSGFTDQKDLNNFVQRKLRLLILLP
jgi:hypothetical protein